MKQINKQFLFKVILAGIAFTGCNKNYLNVNSDPNSVTDANITAELIFPQAEVAVGGRQASGNFLFLDHWIGYFAPNGTFAPQQNEITYNIDFSFGNALFVNHYNTLFDLNQCQVKGLAEKDFALVGASMVMSAKLYQELVDLYGDIPYTQAFQVNKTTTPTYDKAQDIYNALQKKLDSAIVYLNEAAPKAFAAADVINHGNTNLWILFANTIKLRLLIRQSEISGFDASADMAKIIANGGVLQAGQTISVNPGFSNDVNKQNPFYANFGYTPTGVQATTADDANNYIVTLLSNSNDPRLGRFFYPVGNDPANGFVGPTFGDLQANLPLGSQSSYFGPGLIGDSSASGDPAAGPGATQNQWIMPSFESMFFWAEAVARGWAPGNAQTAYMAAVTESFVWLGVPDAKNAATAYMTSFPQAEWANSGAPSAESEATFIAFQKYLAMVGIDPEEAYSDIRRLNMLTDNSYISTAPGVLGNGILPVRLLYPQSEYTSNSTNVLKEGTINPFTSKLFWDTN
jgi:hypothetical protein